MTDAVTLIRPDPDTANSAGFAAALPTDIQEQVRQRLRLLAALAAMGFAIGPVALTAIVGGMTLAGNPPPGDVWEGANLFLVHGAAVVVSLGAWWRLRDLDLSPSGLLRLGVTFQVTNCLVIGILTYGGAYRVTGQLPNLTWIPAAVIFFPLVVPGPPRLMLWAAVAGAAMAPVSLVVLEVSGLAVTTPPAYISAVVNSAVAVVFAYVGARAVHGLGRKVIEARRMGSYRLERELGRGGMGEVWAARHRLLARPAAIKLIRPDVLATNPDGQRIALQRFEREAQATSRLRSPHTIELYDYGVSDDGVFYYVMELLDGVDAQELVETGGPVPPARAVYLLRQACLSLSEAHGAGMIHRDVKPANIFVCRYGEEFDFVKVLDFGLVKDDPTSAVSQPNITVDNLAGGTPAFIAPEQALGKADLDGRVDLYALGCVAYWLLTAKYVFDGGTPMELVTQHVHTTPVSVSERTSQTIPRSLDDLVMSCLSKDPAQRPATARELHARLGAVDVEPWTTDGAADCWSRHPERANAPSPLGVEPT